MLHCCCSLVTAHEKATSRCYRLTAVCLGLLCVLLLTAITVLWIKFTVERDQLQTDCKELPASKVIWETTHVTMDLNYDIFSALGKQTHLHL